MCCRWYTKGAGAGVKEWDATNSTFPDGLVSVRGTQHHGLPSENMALITSECGATRSLGIEWTIIEWTIIYRMDYHRMDYPRKRWP